MDGLEIVDIDPGGDVVLICGTAPDEVKLRVSSAILIRSSPVLKALLSPRFKEGTDLLKTSYVEIPLPDESGSDMQIICDVLYHRNDIVPETLDPARILSVAAHTDKYDCVKAMKYMARIWTQQYLQTSQPSKLGELLKATLYFNDKYLFDETCKSIIWRSVGPINPRSGAYLELDGLRSVFEELNRQRIAVLDHITDFIDKRIEWFARKKCPKQKCNVVSIMLCHFITELSNIRLYGAWDRQKSSIAQLEYDLTRFDCKRSQIARPSRCGSKECDNAETQGDKMLSIGELAMQLELYIEIPCFSCARKGKACLEECEHE